MIENTSLGSIMGAPAVGPDDEKIGSVGQIFVDPVTGTPNWATVHTGLFGRHENFVPLDQATWDREKLHLPFDKNTVKDAPRIDADEALTPESEAELYRYYDITPDVPLTADPPALVEPVEAVTPAEPPTPVEPVETPTADTDRAEQQRAETHADASGERHHDPEAEAAGAEFAQQSRMQRYEASDPAHADASPHDGEARGPRHRA